MGVTKMSEKIIPTQKRMNTKLKSLRVERGLKQDETAYKCDMPFYTYRNYEQGQINLPNVPLIRILKICNVLKCNIEDIIEDESILNALEEYYSTQNEKA
jgi:transcriptional regulator with XRE-family HTH domain